MDRDRASLVAFVLLTYAVVAGAATIVILVYAAIAPAVDSYPPCTCEPFMQHYLTLTFVAFVFLLCGGLEYRDLATQGLALERWEGRR